MKTLLSLVLSAFILVSMVPAASAHQHEHGQHVSADYSCPMHPEVTGQQGDSCPKCGMDLAAKTDKAATSKHQGKKCDSCPNHGAKAHKDMHADTHACPMHPSVTGKKGDTCPDCGMNLTASKTASQHHGKKCDSCPNHGAKAHKDMHADTHACPMNPKITGKKGDTCPKCGMNLEPIKTAANGAEKHPAHHKQQ